MEHYATALLNGSDVTIACRCGVILKAPSWEVQSAMALHIRESQQ